MYNVLNVNIIAKDRITDLVAHPIPIIIKGSIFGSLSGSKNYIGVNLKQSQNVLRY